MTKHLDSLKIQNFRMLEDFEVAKLGQVNLIVGKNNSGKSTVLEALRVYAAHAHIETLKDLLKARDDAYDFIAEEYLDIENSINPFTALTSNRVKSHHWSFSISNISRNKEIIFLYSTPSKNPPESMAIRSKAYHTLKNFQLYYNEPIRFFCSIKNGIHYKVFWKNEPHLDTWLSSSDGDFLPLSLGFIDIQLTSINELATLWDKVSLAEQEDLVYDILKAINPEFKNLIFVENPHNPRGGRVPYMSAVGQERRIPLKSQGYGTQRLLQIALAIYQAKDGFLLIDEFENGLHYSVQEQVWGLIFDMAQRLNIQVFATTHSWDCIEAFSKVANQKSDMEGVLINMGKSIRNNNKGQVIATVFDETELAQLTQADVELR